MGEEIDELRGGSGGGERGKVRGEKVADGEGEREVEVVEEGGEVGEKVGGGRESQLGGLVGWDVYWVG